MDTPLRVLLAAIGAVALVAVVWGFGLDPHPDDGARDGWRTRAAMPDKLAHAAGGYAGALTAACAGGAWAGLAVAVVAGFGWELQQRYPRGGGRGVFSWRDWLATAAGGALGAAWWALWHSR